MRVRKTEENSWSSMVTQFVGLFSFYSGACCNEVFQLIEALPLVVEAESLRGILLFITPGTLEMRMKTVTELRS